MSDLPITTSTPSSAVNSSAPEAPSVAVAPKPLQFVATSGVRLELYQSTYQDSEFTEDYTGTTASAFVQPGLLWQHQTPQTGASLQAQPTIGLDYAQNESSYTWHNQTGNNRYENIPGLLGGTVSGGISHDTLTGTVDLTPTQLDAGFYADYQTIPDALPRTTRQSLDAGTELKYTHTKLNGEKIELSEKTRVSWSEVPTDTEGATSDSSQIEANLTTTQTKNGKGVHTEEWYYRESYGVALLDKNALTSQQDILGILQYQLPLNPSISIAFGAGYLNESSDSYFGTHSDQNVPLGAVRITAKAEPLSINTDNQFLAGASAYETDNQTGALPYFALRGKTSLFDERLSFDYKLSQTGALNLVDPNSLGDTRVGLGATVSTPIGEEFSVDGGLGLKLESSTITGVNNTSANGSVSVKMNPLSDRYSMRDTPFVVQASYSGGFSSITPMGEKDFVNEQSSHAATLTATIKI